MSNMNRVILDSFKRYAKKSASKPENPLLVRRLVDRFKKKAIRVSVLGGDTPIGEPLSLLLKINPLVSHLYLQGDNCKGVAFDLSHIDTRTMVYGFYGSDIDKAVRRAEIVIILPALSNNGEPALVRAEEKFRNEYERLIRITRLCTIYCPKALIYVCVPPVSMTVPLVSEVYRRTHWYNPARIIGSVDNLQVRINCRLARFNNLDPCGVQVPIIGGPDQETVIPLFSRATPAETGSCEAECLTKEIRGIPMEQSVTSDVKEMEYCDSSPLSTAFGINRSITTIALGLMGDDRSHLCGFIRSNILPSSCRYLVSTLRIGPYGVYHNYGIPLLTPMELNLLERAVMVLDEREKLAMKMFESVDEKRIARAN